MIRQTVRTTPTRQLNRRYSALAVPISFWPQASVPTLPNRWSNPAESKATLHLPVDVFSTEDEAVIRAALPGVHPEAIDVSVSKNTVTIRAELPTLHAPEGSRITWMVSELGGGRIERTIRLPFQIEESEVEAQVANGMLQLVLPKVAAEKPHRISVQVRPELKYELEAGASDDETFAAD